MNFMKTYGKMDSSAKTWLFSTETSVILPVLTRSPFSSGVMAQSVG